MKCYGPRMLVSLLDKPDGDISLYQGSKLASRGRPRNGLEMTLDEAFIPSPKTGRRPVVRALHTAARRDVRE